jgi:hypothetical protein
VKYGSASLRTIILAQGTSSRQCRTQPVPKIAGTGA